MFCLKKILSKLFLIQIKIWKVNSLMTGVGTCKEYLIWFLATSQKKKIQLVTSHNPPGKVAVTCRELQYHSNLHKYNS